MQKSFKKNPESYFPTIVSNVKGFAIFTLDQSGLITSWNKGCEQMKGFTSEEVIGKHYDIFFPDFLKEKKMPQKELDETHQKGRYDTENWRIKKNGDLFWAYVVLTKVVAVDGEFLGYVKITQDHSEKKRLEAELNKKKEDLEYINIELEKNKEMINNDLDEFVYIASHDLRSPISNMEGILNAIADHGYFQDRESKPMFDMLSLSVEKLKKTILQLTEISKIQVTVQNDMQDINLGGLIEEVMLKLREIIANNKVKIEIDISECPIIKFSPQDLKSIVFNLVSNGIKYQSPERKPEILIKTTKTDEHYVLIVKDNGLGIKKENQVKIFSMFRRFHDHVEGTGIGLYMVKRVVDKAGGRIEVDSELSRGSIFKVFFKL